MSAIQIGPAAPAPTAGVVCGALLVRAGSPRWGGMLAIVSLAVYAYTNRDAPSH